MSSNFKVNVANVLGLQQQRTRSDLLSLALSQPSAYFALRQDVIEKITVGSVERIYDEYWNILTVGMANKTQINFPGTSTPFQPNLPEQQVNKFALKVANAVREIAEEAVESILPMKYNDLAVSSARGVLHAKGIDM